MLNQSGAILKLNVASAALMALGVRLRMEISTAAAHQSQIDLNDRRIAELLEETESILAAARGEERDLTDEERKKTAEIQTDIDTLEADNKVLQRQIDQINRKNQSTEPAARKTRPEPTDGEIDDDEPAPAKTRQSNPVVRSPAAPRRTAAGMWGWDTQGQFLHGVMSAKTTGSIDDRLKRKMGVNTEVGEQGAFAVPPDMANSLMTKVTQESLIISRCDQQFVSGNRYVTPIDEDEPWNNASGIRVEWLGERQKPSGSQPNIGEFAVDLNKLGALVEVSNESLEDSTLLESLITTKAPEKIREEVERVIIAGDGAKKPLGILNSPARVTIDKESGQTADTIVLENVDNLWTRAYAKTRGSSIFLSTQDAEEQLRKMKYADNSPAYVPQNDMANRPHDSLLGKPLTWSESMNQLGDEGDIMLADFRQYVLVMKRTGIRQDFSMHLLFDQDASVFRFIFRIGGSPWWSKPVTARTGTTRSCFTTIAERA